MPALDPDDTAAPVEGVAHRIGDEFGNNHPHQPAAIGNIRNAHSTSTSSMFLLLQFGATDRSAQLAKVGRGVDIIVARRHLQRMIEPSHNYAIAPSPPASAALTLPSGDFAR